MFKQIIVKSGRSEKMLNLFSLKEKKEEGAKGGAGAKKKASAAQLRITKVLSTNTNYDEKLRKAFLE